jgi:copper resistance protein C
MRPFLSPLAVASVLAIAPAPGFAHAFLDHAEPGVGSAATPAPAEIKIWFTEALEPAFSTIGVTDAQGRHVEQSKARVDAGNPMLLEVKLAPLPPGKYTVTWRVISIDTHPTEGNFTFTVEP